MKHQASWFIGALMTVALVACSGGDDDTDGTTPDAGMVDTPDSGDDIDGGMVDASTADAGDDRDAGPPDTGIVDPETEPYRTRRNSGSPDNRIDVVIIGDGYTREELGTTFTEHVGAATGRTFSGRRRRNDPTQPFRSYNDYFNVHQIHIASNESGIDTSATMVDTALDAREGPCGGIGGAGCPLDFTKATAAIDAALAGSGITPDIRVVILNTDTDESGSYDAPGGAYVVMGGGFGNDQFIPSEILMREMAIAWAGLARETTDNPGGLFPGGPLPGVNTSTSSNGSWPLWDGYEQMGLETMAAMDALNPLGAYMGAAGYMNGIYRPTQNSKLGGELPLPFNAVSRERIVQAIFETISPLDDFADNTQRLTDPNQLYVDAIDNDKYTVTWAVDGVEVPNFNQNSFGPVAFGVAPGVHTVTASVTDDTTFVRGDRTGMDAYVSWDILISQ